MRFFNLTNAIGVFTDWLFMITVHIGITGCVLCNNHRRPGVCFIRDALVKRLGSFIIILRLSLNNNNLIKVFINAFLNQLLLGLICKYRDYFRSDFRHEAISLFLLCLLTTWTGEHLSKVRRNHCLEQHSLISWNACIAVVGLCESYQMRRELPHLGKVRSFD